MKKTVNIENSILESVRDALVDILQGNKFSGTVQMKVFRNRHKIIEAWKPIEELRSNLIKKYSENGAIQPNHENWPDFVEEWRPIAQEKTEVEIEPILWDELYEKSEPQFEGSSLQLLLDYQLIVESLDEYEEEESEEEEKKAD